MTPAAVENAARAAGRHLVAPPAGVALDLLGERPELLCARAIYLAYTSEGTLHYIGKVDRASGTVAGRLAEHLRVSRHKRSAWRSLWLVPLSHDMPAHDLLTLERSLIRCHRPIGNVLHRAA